MFFVVIASYYHYLFALCVRLLFFLGCVRVCVCVSFVSFLLTEASGLLKAMSSNKPPQNTPTPTSCTPAL